MKTWWVRIIVFLMLWEISIYPVFSMNADGEYKNTPTQKRKESSTPNKDQPRKKKLKNEITDSETSNSTRIENDDSTEEKEKKNKGAPQYRIYLLRNDLARVETALNGIPSQDIQCLVNPKGYWYALPKAETYPGF